jgi:hypothetical protein
MSKTVALACVALVALSGAPATVDAKSVSLNNDNFDSLVISGGKNAFVKYQAPW